MQVEDSSAQIQIDRASDPKYKVKEAATKLAISRQTIYREVAAGHLKWYWIGSSIRIGLSHTNEYLSRNRRHALAIPMAGGK